MINNGVNYNKMPAQYKEREIVEEVSETLFYIGKCKTFCNPNMQGWQIQKIVKVDNSWMFQFPNGSQEYNYIWDERGTYAYV